MEPLSQRGKAYIIWRPPWSESMVARECRVEEGKRRIFLRLHTISTDSRPNLQAISTHSAYLDGCRRSGRVVVFPLPPGGRERPVAIFGDVRRRIISTSIAFLNDPLPITQSFATSVSQPRALSFINSGGRPRGSST